MNRSTLERELKKVGVSLNGWVPVIQCDVCKARWEPFTATNGSAAPTARLDYWRCPNMCNADSKVGREIETVIPRYMIINDVPGMIFDVEDSREFERYVRSMDATEIINR
jgi:hypothetical protein